MPLMLNNTPAWPAFIKLLGDDELIFLANESSFLEKASLYSKHLQPQDFLADSTGHIYHFLKDEHHKTHLKKTEQTLSLEAILQLVRLHAAQDGACCVSKLSANTIDEAISLLE